jgi:hypothetical protein
VAWHVLWVLHRSFLHSGVDGILSDADALTIDYFEQWIKAILKQQEDGCTENRPVPVSNTFLPERSLT